MGFTVIKDMIGGGRPSPINIPYNGMLDADSTTLRYKGSLVKMMEFDNVDHGSFFTFGGIGTAGNLNVAGILDEEAPASGNYLPDATTYDVVLRKMIPVFPSTIIRGEYSQTDAAGAAMTDTGATCSAASATFTIDTDTNDEMTGSWVYMLTGSSAGALHYILDTAADTSATFATVMANPVVSTDTFLVINKANTGHWLMNDTYSGFKSEIAVDLHVHRGVGILNYIKAPGVPFQPLQRKYHDGVIIPNARFYHDFTLPALNIWCNGIAAA